MATVHDLHAHRLIAFARRLRTAQRDDAIGHGLAVALDLAQRATYDFGIEVQLVRWRVTQDPRRLDHWALLLRDGRVLDVAGARSGRCHDVATTLQAYPDNHSQPRTYPVALLLPAYETWGASFSDRLSLVFLRFCAWRLLTYDLSRAAYKADFGSAGDALRYAMAMRSAIKRRAARAHTSKQNDPSKSSASPRLV